MALETLKKDKSKPNIPQESNQETNQVKMILMLYDGSIVYLKKAIEFAKDKDIKNKNIYINKAADIIIELNNALDEKTGGEIAINLRSLYIFMGRHLVDASINDNSKGLNEVIRMLSSLKEGWESILEEGNKKKTINTMMDN